MVNSSMNLISNNCVAGNIYRDYADCEYSNPFIWTYITPINFKKLIINYNNINFDNYKIELRSNLKHPDELSPVATFDNEVEINYIHYFYNEKLDNISDSTNKSTYIVSSNICDYLASKINSRLIRMNSAGNPVFIIDAPINVFKSWTMDELNDIRSIHTEFTIVYLVPDYYRLIPANHNNIIVLRESDKSSTDSDSNLLWSNPEFQRFISE